MILSLGTEWVDPEDPTVIAENELLGAAAAIEAAAKKLEQLKPRAKPKVRKRLPTSLRSNAILLGILHAAWKIPPRAVLKLMFLIIVSHLCNVCISQFGFGFKVTQIIWIMNAAWTDLHHHHLHWNEKPLFIRMWKTFKISHDVQTVMKMNVCCVLFNRKLMRV